jgi:acetyltransferase-like isoleucine patch superfamily enzyme
VALGLVLIDLLYFALLGALGLLAAFSGGRVWDALGPGPVRGVAAPAAAAAAWVGAVLALAAVTPKPRPGRYRVMGHPVFFLWVAHFVLRRCLDLPPLSTLIAQSNLLRFLVLRCFGARVAFSASMSSDAVVLDPALLEVGAGSVVGSQSLLGGHLLTGRLLRLETIRIGAGVLVSARCALGPGVTVGDGAQLGFGAVLGLRCEVGPGAKVGGLAALPMACRVGARGVVPTGALLPVGAVVEAGTTWTAGAAELKEE